MKINCFWTREDVKIFQAVLRFAKSESNIKNTEDSIENILEHLKVANDKTGRKGCNDCPSEIEKLLTAKEWNKIWVEYHHYNGDIEEISSPTSYALPDFCLFYYFTAKIKNIKAIPQ